MESNIWLSGRVNKYIYSYCNGILECHSLFACIALTQVHLVFFHNDLWIFLGVFFVLSRIGKSFLVSIVKNYSQAATMTISGYVYKSTINQQSGVQSLSFCCDWALLPNIVFSIYIGLSTSCYQGIPSHLPLINLLLIWTWCCCLVQIKLTAYLLLRCATHIVLVYQHQVKKCETTKSHLNCVIKCQMLVGSKLFV